MTETVSTAPRERLDIDPARVIKVLPAMGKLMITAKNLGATHERIGSIEAVTEQDGWLICSGVEHDSRIDPSIIKTITVDRTSIMGEQAYPRIDFITAEDVVLFSVVGFAGLEPFDAALAGFGPGVALPVVEKPVPGERGEVSETDPGAVPFKAAVATQIPVAIMFNRAGFHQVKHGPVEKIKAGMGFNNVMRADFHLHLKANAVAIWRSDAGASHVDLVALDAEGSELGLVLRGPADAFVLPARAEIVS